MKPDFSPLFELLAEIVHSEYNDPITAIQTTIPVQIDTILGMVDALDIEPAKKESLHNNELKYIFIARIEISAFNQKGDYSDAIFNEIVIDRWQVDAERTRIYLELRERDWEAEPSYMDLDF